MSNDEDSKIGRKKVPMEHLLSGQALKDLSSKELKDLDFRNHETLRHKEGLSSEDAPRFPYKGFKRPN